MHLPLTNETKNLFSYDNLIKMKKGLYLIKINEDKLGFRLLNELIEKNSDLKTTIEAIIIN